MMQIFSAAALAIGASGLAGVAPGVAALQLLLGQGSNSPRPEPEATWRLREPRRPVRVRRMSTAREMRLAA
jgi:hypothetical protein